MKIYKCDTCEKTHENEYPRNWIEISGKIINNLPNRAIFEANTELHFCSRNCFEKFFFQTDYINHFFVEIRAFSGALTHISNNYKRELYLKFFKNNYDLKSFDENMKNEINGQRFAALLFSLVNRSNVSIYKKVYKQVEC